MATQPVPRGPEAGGFHPEYMNKPVEITVKGPDGTRTFKSVSEMLEALREERENNDRRI